MEPAAQNPESSLADLKNVLKETLDARGSLGQIKARIRAEVFAALDDESVPKPKLSNENLIINELIREYLEYNGYRHAQSVFLSESGQPLQPPFHRQFLAKELHVDEDQRFTHVPLLYGIVASLQQGNDRMEYASLRQDQSASAKTAEWGGASPAKSYQQNRAGDERRTAAHATDITSELSPLMFHN